MGCGGSKAAQTVTQPTEPGNVTSISVKPSIGESKGGFEIDNRPKSQNGRESVLTLPTAPKTPSTPQLCMAAAANPAAREALAAILADLDEDSESVSDLKPSIQAEPRATTTTMAANGLKTPCKTPVPKTPGPAKTPAPTNPFQDSNSRQPSAVASKAPSAVPTPLPPKEEQASSD